MDNLKSKVLSGVFWQYAQRFGVQGVQFVVSLFLARILLPSDFGTIALIGVFITLSNIFIDGGFGNALIQKKEVDQIDYSSVFYLNLGIAVLLYGILFLCSPFIASFYNEPILIPVLRVQSLSLLIMAFSCVQNSLLVREMKFKKNFGVNIMAVMVSAIVGLMMAYNGFGIWSLVVSQLCSQIMTVIGYWYMVKWRPLGYFSLERVRILFNYSSKVLLGSLFNVVYNNVYNLVIGKQYNTIMLGYYNRGMLIPTLIVDSAANTLNSVMFPALSSLQDDKIQIKNIVRRMLKLVSYVVFFLMAILFVLAKPLVVVLLTDKWLPAVPFMQIVCITVSFYPIYLMNISALTSLGRSDLYLKATLLSKMVSLGLIILAIPFGVYYMVSAGALGAFISIFIVAQWNKKLINYTIKNQLLDILPSFLLAIFTSIIVSLITFLPLDNWAILLFGSGFAVLLYLFLSFVFKVNAAIYIYSQIKFLNKFKKRK